MSQELNELPSSDFENSMVAETPDVLALLAEKITEDQNELELKKIELDCQLKREQSDNHRIVNIERFRSQERIARHRWNVIEQIATMSGQTLTLMATMGSIAYLVCN